MSVRWLALLLLIPLVALRRRSSVPPSAALRATVVIGLATALGAPTAAATRVGTSTFHGDRN